MIQSSIRCAPSPRVEAERELVPVAAPTIPGARRRARAAVAATPPAAPGRRPRRGGPDARTGPPATPPGSPGRWRRSGRRPRSRRSRRPRSAISASAAGRSPNRAACSSSSSARSASPRRSYSASSPNSLQQQRHVLGRGGADDQGAVEPRARPAAHQAPRLGRGGRGRPRRSSSAPRRARRAARSIAAPPPASRSSTLITPQISCPASCSASIAASVEPPVVTTSSTTTQRSSGRQRRALDAPLQPVRLGVLAHEERLRLARRPRAPRRRPGPRPSSSRPRPWRPSSATCAATSVGQRGEALGAQDRALGVHVVLGRAPLVSVTSPITSACSRSSATSASRACREVARIFVQRRPRSDLI